MTKDGEIQIHTTTYTFSVHEEEPTKIKALVPKIRTGIWQIFPSVCASITCIPFGLMLGWPSVTYPTLLLPTSVVPITIDQSAMIAGFLMFGNAFGTMVSSRQIGHGPKFGIIVANLLILIGWILMWQATSIHHLLSSRMILGLGHGYGMGQIKQYIKEMTDGSVVFIKYLSVYGLFGFILAYALGPFVDFKQFALICVIISLIVLILVIFLPCTPKELLGANRLKSTKKLLNYLTPGIDVDSEIEKITQSTPLEHKGFTKLIRDQPLRMNFIKFTILLVCQQYCGAPPTLVYTQILFDKCKTPFPELIALGYAVLFFISTIVGIFLVSRYNKKYVLLLSCCTVLILYICEILVIFFEINNLFNYSSVIILYLYIIVYTIGMGTIPFTMIHDWFPPAYREFVVKYFIVLFSVLALTITKIFQILITLFPLYIPFCLFAGIIGFSILFVALFIPSAQKESYYAANLRECTEIQRKK